MDQVLESLCSKQDNIDIMKKQIKNYLKNNDEHEEQDLLYEISFIMKIEKESLKNTFDLLKKDRIFHKHPNFDDISKQIIQQSKELKGIDNHISKDIVDLKKSIKNIENKLKSMDDTLVKLFDILTNITVFIEDAEDINEEDLEDEEDWTPYDERNFSYKDNDDEDNDDDEWSNSEDQS
jgi:hypothetical protein